MNTVQSPMTIADFCAAMGRGELEVNPDYQRSDKVWPPAARSFLIETVLLGFPLPKIFLYQKTDLKSKKTIKEIVDGQQRSKALLDFFNNKLAISKKSEISRFAGKRYDQLDEDDQGAFLNYQLSIDLFVSASLVEIRQAFRRLNSYTVPLNPEELRHAEYQGDFKWFISEITDRLDETMLRMGVLSAKQIIRMQDTKLWTEFVHSMTYGIKTTKPKDLTDVYKRFDKEGMFADASALKERINQAVEFIVALPEIHNGPLMRPHNFYSLALAVSHKLAPADQLKQLYPRDAHGAFVRDVAVANLSKLASALETENAGDLEPFRQACAGKTNVEGPRVTRFQWLSRALDEELI